MRARDQVIGPGPEPEAGTPQPRYADGSSPPVSPWQSRSAPVATAGSVRSRPDRCAQCKRVGGLLYEDRGRQLCQSCMYPGVENLAAPKEAS